VKRLKPSAIAARETILRVHLLPAMGSKRLNEIEVRDVNDLKSVLCARSEKTINNVLACLSSVLKLAIEEGMLERMPWAKIGIFKIDRADRQFYTFEQYQLLREVAEQEDWRANLIVLLGGDAGLRLGEMMALEWDDIGFGLGGGNGLIVVRQSEWKRNVTNTKGGDVRYVLMTQRLATALQKAKHLRHRRVLIQDSGQPVTMKIIQAHAARVARKALLPTGVHILRHTFCSHLAMNGQAATTIQQMAGHKDLQTTQRYMHLQEGVKEAAIQSLERGPTRRPGGDNHKLTANL
jgi:integrase